MLTSLTEVVIESDRLRLLPTSEAYVDDVFANFTAELTIYMFPAPPIEIAETREFLRSARAGLERGEELQLAILLKPGGEFIGHCGLHHLDSPTPELGIWIKKAAHGNRYGREAIAAVARWALEHVDFEYLIYPVDRRNTASRSIPEALGGRVEAEYEETGAGGNLLDLLEYRLHRAQLAAGLESCS